MLHLFDLGSKFSVSFQAQIESLLELGELQIGSSDDLLLPHPQPLIIFPQLF